MLNTANPDVAHCLLKAHEAREAAKRAPLSADKAFFADLEQSWLMLANRFELEERTGKSLRNLC